MRPDHLNKRFNLAWGRGPRGKPKTLNRHGFDSLEEAKTEASKIMHNADWVSIVDYHTSISLEWSKKDGFSELVPIDSPER